MIHIPYLRVCPDRYIWQGEQLSTLIVLVFQCRRVLVEKSNDGHARMLMLHREVAQGDKLLDDVRLPKCQLSIFTSTWQRAHVVGGSLPEGVEALLLPVEPLPCVVPVIPWENPLQNYDLLIISILIGWGAQKQWQPGKLPVITLTKCPNGLKSQKSKVLVQLKKKARSCEITIHIISGSDNKR